MRAFVGIVVAMIWAPLSLAQTLLSQAPYSSPQFLKMTDVNGFVRVLELDWDGGLFRMIPTDGAGANFPKAGVFEHFEDTIEFWPVGEASFKRRLLIQDKSLTWHDWRSGSERQLYHLEPISAFTALRLSRTFQVGIKEYADSLGLSQEDNSPGTRPSYIDPVCTLELNKQCTTHQICFAAAAWSPTGATWRGPADAPWRTLANSRGLDCNVPDAEVSDLPAGGDNAATIETPLEKEKSSEVAAREDWYFVEGNELHYFPDEILEDDHNELDQILRDHPDVDTLVLTSNGGYFSYAMDIVQVVFDYQLNTKADIMCYSACTFILLAGEERSLTRGARVGFHQSYWEAEDIEEYYLEYQDEYDSVYDFVADEIEFAKTDAYEEISFMIEQGVDPAFAAKAVLSTPGDDMWYPKASELLAANVITK